MLSIMIGMKLGPESNCFVQLNPEKRKYDKSFEEEKNYAPVRRSWKRLCRRILNQKMSTKFQTLLGRNDSDFCSCARTNWWRNPGQNINGSKLKSCTKPRKERNLKKEVEACQLSLNLSQNCSDYYLHLARGLFAIRNVQFNLFLFQLKDVIHLCQWWKSRRPIQNQKWSKMIYNCSEFCQEPPESSGRWECPALRRSVHVNPTMSTNYSWSLPCSTSVAYPTQLLSSATAVTPATLMAEAAPIPSPTRKSPRRCIEGWTLVKCKIYLLFIVNIVSAFPLKCLLLDDVFFSWIWSFIDHTSTLKLHGVSGDEPEDQDGVPSQPWCDYQLHDDGAAEEGCNQDCKTQFKGTAQWSSLSRRWSSEDPPSLFN